MHVKKFALQMALLFLLFLTIVAPPLTLQAQDLPETPTPLVDDEDEADVPNQVDVQPVAQDEQIEERLTRILQATDWFTTPMVEVEEGVVFLDGQTRREEYREWASNLARNTQDVVAVVNRIEVVPGPIWDFSPALIEIRTLWRRTVQAIPVVIFGIVVLVGAWWLMQPISSLSQRLLRNRLGSPLLTRIVAQAIAIPVFLLGIYLVLQVAGLTRLALTLLGGTGIVGIVIGFAFRDIAENFLASILLSMRNPFQSKDLIEVAGYSGIVQQMNTRSTVLMTLEGNHIQIPNATVFKNTIINYTANPNRRSDFLVGVGYDAALAQVQTVIDQVLNQHPAVLETPEPLVLVDTLGAATVNLRIYFWYDATQYAPIKIKSSLLRLTKRALTDAGISMPDEAREVIFPQGVPIVSDQPAAELPPRPAKAARPAEIPGGQPESAAAALPEPVTTAAEGNLRSEDAEIHEQSARSRTVEEGENLLEDGQA
jgi:small-conductance mechanosensitive channel